MMMCKLSCDLPLYVHGLGGGTIFHRLIGSTRTSSALILENLKVSSNNSSVSDEINQACVVNSMGGMSNFLSKFQNGRIPSNI